MCFRIRLLKRRAACSLLVRRRPVGSREPRAFRSTRAEQSRTFRWTEKDQITSRQFKSVFGANSSASEVTKETPFRNGGDRFASLSCRVPGCLMSRGGSVPRRLPPVHLCHIRTSDGRAVATLVPHTFPSDLTERRGVASDLAAGCTPTFPAAARPPRPPAAPRSARRPQRGRAEPSRLPSAAARLPGVFLSVRTFLVTTFPVVKEPEARGHPTLCHHRAFVLTKKAPPTPVRPLRRECVSVRHTRPAGVPPSPLGLCSQHRPRAASCPQGARRRRVEPAPASCAGRQGPAVPLSPRRAP